jgi:hypothetical protein
MDIKYNEWGIGMKKIVFSFLLVFCATFSFSQQQTFVWSTVSGTNARIISMSSVKAEVMRLYDRHRWINFERSLNDDFVLDRMENRNTIVNLYNRSLNDPRADKIQQQHERQIITWYDTHRNFVYMRNIGSGMSIVSFVIGDNVMEVTFCNDEYQGWYPTHNNRNNFERDIDWMLRGFPQTR